MRILFINVLYAPFIGGGAEITLKNLVEGARDLGHEVRVSSFWDKDDEEEIIDGTPVYRAKIPNIYLPYGKIRQPFLKRRIWHILDIYNPISKKIVLRQIRDFKPDIISIHNTQGWSCSIWDAVSESNVPAIQVLHDLYLLCATNMFKNNVVCKKQCLTCKLMRLPYKSKSNKLKAVVGVSNFILNKLLSYGYFKDVPIKKVIYNSRKLEVFMRILVTGGAGFIGSNFIHYLFKEHPDYRIVNFDKLTYAGNLENLKGVDDKPKYHFVKSDIANRELVEYIFEKFNPCYVVNFAAESHVDRSIEGSEVFIKLNVLGTQVLLDVAKGFWLKNNIFDYARFLQINTDEVYGSLPLESSDKFTEESPLKPNSPYSASKAAADLLVRAYYVTYGMPVSITRSSNNFGPRQYPEKLIPLMITNALQGKPLPVYGDGQNVRDWIYVEDNVRAIDLVLHKGKVGEIYNIGGSKERKNINLVNLICEILSEVTGKPTEEYKKLITFVKNRPGHDRRYALSIEKIKRELVWSPLVNFSEGIMRTAKWYVEEHS